MNFHTILDTACYGISLVGGISLGIAPFTQRGRVAPHWIRVALWLVCLIAVTWSVLGFTLFFGASDLSEHAHSLVRHMKTLCAGMGVGIVVLLFASGEFISAFCRCKIAVK